MFDYALSIGRVLETNSCTVALCVSVQHFEQLEPRMSKGPSLYWRASMSVCEDPVTFIVGPDDSAYAFLRVLPTRLEVRNGTIVVAWARRSGIGLLYSALGASLRNVDVMVGMANRGTTAEALALLRSMARRVFIYHKHHLQTFHPKVYLFDDGLSPPAYAALLVGSSNLTGGGLYQNIEANLALELRPSSQDADRATYDSVVCGVSDLQASLYCEELTGDDRIRQLLQDRYISTEAELARRRRRDNIGAPRRGERRGLPESPPPPLPQFALPPLLLNFEDVGQGGTILDPARTARREALVNDASGEFYVRTLTANDVNKLRGDTLGTAEWDIGVTARNAHPTFWGWPDEYAEVVRTLPRLEWTVKGSLRSSSTGSMGVDVEVALWFREERPKHAAEHRLRIGPKAALVNATPIDFDTSSLVVLERLPDGRSHTFLVQLLTSNDAEFEDYSAYLTQARPRHRYGYGP